MWGKELKPAFLDSIMPQEILISRPEVLEKFKKAIKSEGAGSMHIVADFDRTLTTAFVDGTKVPSQISILRDGNYLTKDYASKAKTLADKYHSIEVDLSLSLDLSLDERKKAMHQWWSEHFKLLIESSLNKKDIESVVNSSKIKFREKALDLLDFLHEKGIPLIILSSCGLGTEAIRLQLAKVGKAYTNINIISNLYEWDGNGKAVKVIEPIIHTLNKEEASIKHYPAFDKIKDRKNVLLIGDSVSDVDMIKGFNCRNLLKVGFLNESAEKNQQEYKKVYDIIILNDGSMNYIYNLLKESLE